jgi:hypothetical protein
MGPFSDFTANSFNRIESSSHPAHLRPSEGSGSQKRRATVQHDFKLLSDSLLFLEKMSRGKSEDKAVSFWGREILEKRVGKNLPKLMDLRSLELSSARESKLGPGLRPNGQMLPELEEIATELLTAALQLQPTPQWAVSIGHAFVPKAQDILWTSDASRLRKIYSQAKKSAGNSYLKAWLILISIWHLIYEVPLPFDVKPLLKCSNSDDSAWNIAKTLYTLTLGEHIPKEQLIKYLRQPTFRRHLEIAGWAVPIRVKSSSLN